MKKCDIILYLNTYSDGNIFTYSLFLDSGGCRILIYRGIKGGVVWTTVLILYTVYVYLGCLLKANGDYSRGEGQSPLQTYPLASNSFCSDFISVQSSVYMCPYMCVQLSKVPGVGR